MTRRLEEAYARTAQLPAEEQDHIAALILDDLEDEARWDQAFASSASALSKLARKALEEHRSGKTERAR